MALPASAAAPPTKQPGTLTVALAMPSAGFQVGAVRGRTVILAVRKPLFVENPSRLSYDLFAKRCDAVVADAPALAVQRREAPDRYGPLVGRILTRESYAIALEEGSPLRDRVDLALKAIEREGILVRLRQRWLGADTSKLPVLR